MPSTPVANDRISATRSVPTPIQRMPLTSTRRPYSTSDDGGARPHP
jgi:hypothetical protein